MTVAAVLTAAGSGTRLGHPLPKALVPLAGEPLVLHAARRLLAARGSSGERVGTLVVTAPADHLAHVERSLTGLGADADGVRVVVVAGGVTRQASVAAALVALGASVPLRAGDGDGHPDDDDGSRAGGPRAGAERPEGAGAGNGDTGAGAVRRDDPGAGSGLGGGPGVGVVLVHDAARPLAPVELIGRVLDAVVAGRTAVVPALPVTDTVKRVEPADAPPAGPPARRVETTVARDLLRAVQTPQGFTLDVLRRAHDEAAAHAHDESLAATDDAGLVERLGGPVWVVQGDERAAKITTPRDLLVAGLLVDGPHVDGLHADEPTGAS